jgi:hypothetical protein
MLRLLATRREWVHELWLQRGKGSSNSKLRLFGLRDLTYTVTQDDWEVFNRAYRLFPSLPRVVNRLSRSMPRLGPE